MSTLAPAKTVASFSLLDADCDSVIGPS